MASERDGVSGTPETSSDVLDLALGITNTNCFRVSSMSRARRSGSLTRSLSTSEAEHVLGSRFSTPSRVPGPPFPRWTFEAKSTIRTSEEMPDPYPGGFPAWTHLAHDILPMDRIRSILHCLRFCARSCRNRDTTDNDLGLGVRPRERNMVMLDADPRKTWRSSSGVVCGSRNVSRGSASSAASFSQDSILLACPRCRISRLACREGSST